MWGHDGRGWRGTRARGGHGWSTYSDHRAFPSARLHRSPVAPIAGFTDDQVSGPTGCYSFSGTYTADGGTTWQATGINNGTGGVASLVADSTVTAEFADDGTLTGSAGCNSYNGSYEVLGDTMTIGPLATTLMACEPEVDEQEVNYLAALENVTQFTLDRDRLELRDDEGALQVGFTSE